MRREDYTFYYSKEEVDKGLEEYGINTEDLMRRAVDCLYDYEERRDIWEWDEDMRRHEVFKAIEEAELIKCESCGEYKNFEQYFVFVGNEYDCYECLTGTFREY